MFNNKGLSVLNNIFSRSNFKPNNKIIGRYFQ